MKIDIVRAWKDEAYRQSLTKEAQALLPENPAGGYELSESDLEMVYGAAGWNGPEANLSKSGNCSNAIVCQQSASGTNNFVCFEGGSVDTRTGSGTGNILGALIGTGAAI